MSTKFKVIWITGLSGSGKSTLAQCVAMRLQNQLVRVILLDGDLLRKVFVINYQDKLRFHKNSRIKLAKQYGMLCQMLSEQGFTVVISTISMFQEIYSWNRKHLDGYFEVFLDIPLTELRRRDPKGIYRSYDQGLIKNIAGLDLKIDKPTNPNLKFDFKQGYTASMMADEILKIIV